MTAADAAVANPPPIIPGSARLSALELAERSIEVDPEFGWGYQSLSRAHHLLGHLDDAVVATELAVELAARQPLFLALARAGLDPDTL